MKAPKYEQLELPFMKEMNALNQTQNAIQSMLNLTWNNVLVNLTKPGTKELMRQHGKLEKFGLKCPLLNYYDWFSIEFQK